jgi:hypothetical protein
MRTACSCGLMLSAILLSIEIMANPDGWFGDYVASPDDVFEARLAAEELQRNRLYEMYIAGPRYVRACVDCLMDNIRFLYGAEVCAQTRLCLNNFLQDDSTLRFLGASLNLHATAELERSKIDILSVFNIDLRDILEAVPVDCGDLIALWDPNAHDADNLEVISIHVEAVHGLTYEYDFRALLREVGSEHECLLAAVVAILKQRYGDYGHWRQEARLRAAARPLVDWNEALAS